MFEAVGYAMRRHVRKCGITRLSSRTKLKHRFCAQLNQEEGKVVYLAPEYTVEGTSPAMVNSRNVDVLLLLGKTYEIGA